jgi:aminopeptidase YwaD
MRKQIFLIFALSIITSGSFLFAQTEINSKQIYKHIEFLASDSLKGRQPGTKESKIAAQYIANEFKKYGLKLLGENGFQHFGIKAGLQTGDNWLIINKKSFDFGKDFTVLSYSENVENESDIVFVGYGFNIDTDKLKWDDYQDIDVKEKWVLIFRGHPELDQRMSSFSTYADERTKVLTAKDKGALGVIFTSPSKMDKEDELIPLKMGRGDVKSGLPVIHVKREIADLMLKNSGSTSSQLEEKLNTERKATSFNCKTKAKIKTGVDYKILQTQNVVAFIPGNDPELKNEYLVVGAHYDHLGHGGPGSGSRTPDTLAVHNGADDNASGVATILEIAEKLASQINTIKRSVLFIAFGAEESGLLGSQYFVNNPLVDLKQIKAMLNFDMVGRLDKESGQLSVGGTGTSTEWEGILADYQDDNGIKMAFSKEGFGPSDHASFYAQDIPVLFFNTGVHDDYHTPADDVEFINSQGQENITKIGADIVFNLATRSENLHFQEAGPKKRTSSRGGLKVRLGIMPGFASTENNGLKVEGVTKDGPAEKAGLLKGDLIIAINGGKIQNIYDYMNRLKKFSPGDRISVDVIREDQKKVFIIDL